MYTEQNNYMVGTHAQAAQQLCVKWQVRRAMRW